MKDRRALLYGATGYTGRLVARRLAAAGVDLVLAGRTADRVKEVADPLGLPWCAFDLSEARDLDRALADKHVVLHAAGPFEDTAAPMLAACLTRRVHYLDLSGEWPSFEKALAADAEARAAGVMVMPGVGLTIVATDCLMAMAKEAHPEAVALRLGVSRPEVVTRGTVVSAARLYSPDVIVRRKGERTTVPIGTLTHAFDFGDGLRDCIALSWADVVTGGLTTGLGDITVYSELDWSQRASYRVGGMLMSLTGAEPWRRLGDALAGAWPEAPTSLERDRANFVMVAETVDPWRRVRRLRMRTRDGYTVSELTAAAAVQCVLKAEKLDAGFRTPAQVFGPQFILDLGCAEMDPKPAKKKGEAA